MSKELFSGLTGKKLIRLQAIHANASQRVQRGTKYPPGNRKMKRARHALPKNVIPWVSHVNAGGSAANAELNAMGNCTRVSEASNATRSSDLRQKITRPTRM